MNYFELAVGIGAVLASIPVLLNPTRARQRTERAWQARLGELNAGSEERFFEERRTLEAYPPIKSNWKKWLFGLFLLAFGLYSIFWSGTH